MARESTVPKATAGDGGTSGRPLPHQEAVELLEALVSLMPDAALVVDER